MRACLTNRLRYWLRSAEIYGEIRRQERRYARSANGFLFGQCGVALDNGDPRGWCGEAPGEVVPKQASGGASNSGGVGEDSAVVNNIAVT